MAKTRNNIFAVAADAVDLALDTAGTIGTMVGGIANAVGIGGSKEKSDEKEQDRREADDAAKRVSASLQQEAEALKPRSHKAHASNGHASKTRSTAKHVKKAAKPRKAKKATH